MKDVPLTLEHPNLEATPFYRLVQSYSANKGWRVILSGKLICASATSTVEAVRYFALSVFMGDRKQEHSQLSKTYLYSAKESLRAIWNLDEACQKIHSFVFTKTILNTKENYDESFKVATQNFESLNGSRKQESLQLVLAKSDKRDLSADHVKFMIQSLSLFTKGQFDSGLNKKCKKEIQAIASNLKFAKQRIFVCEKQGAIPQVAIVDEKYLEKYGKLFPYLFANIGQNRIKCCIPEDDGDAKRDLKELQWLIRFEEQHAQNNYQSVTVEEFSKIFNMAKSKYGDVAIRLCISVFKGSRMEESDKEWMHQFIEWLVSNGDGGVFFLDVSLRNVIKKWPNFFNETLMQKILRICQCPLLLIDIAKNAPDSNSKLLYSLELMLNKVYRGHPYTWANEKSTVLMIKKGIEELLSDFNSHVSQKLNPASAYFGGAKPQFQFKTLYEEMRTSAEIFPGCALAWFRMGITFNDEKMINQGFEELVSVNVGSVFDVLNSNKEREIIAAILESNLDLAKNSTFMKSALHPDYMFVEPAILFLNKAGAIPPGLEPQYLKANERMPWINPHYVANEEMVEKAFKALLIDSKDFSVSSLKQVQLIEKKLKSTPTLVLSESVKNWAKQNANAEEGDYKREMADAIMEHVKAQEARLV